MEIVVQLIDLGRAIVFGAVVRAQTCFSEIFCGQFAILAGDFVAIFFC